MRTYNIHRIDMNIILIKVMVHCTIIIVIESTRIYRLESRKGFVFHNEICCFISSLYDPQVIHCEYYCLSANSKIIMNIGISRNKIYMRYFFKKNIKYIINSVCIIISKTVQLTKTSINIIVFCFIQNSSAHNFSNVPISVYIPIEYRF